MGSEIIGIIAGAMAIIGFLSVWVKMGVEKGENKKAVETIEKKVEKNEGAIVEIRNATHSIQLDIARSVGKIEARLDFIKEAIEKLEPKGGRRAAQK